MAPTTSGATATMPSPRTMPSQSPSATGPAGRLAVPHRLRDLAGGDRLGGLAHLRRVDLGRRLRVVHHQRGEALGHRARRHDPHRPRRQGVELLGDGDDVLVAGQHDDVVGVDPLDRREQLGRRRVERLAAADDRLHAELGEQLRDAGPLLTATTAHVTAGSSGADPLPVIAASRAACSADTSSNRSVTRMRYGRPSRSRAASIAAPMSFVWTWQFHVPSPPTTTIESPIAPQLRLEVTDALVGEVAQVHDLVALLADVELAVDAATSAGRRPRTRHRSGRRRPPGGSGSGSPATTWAAASSSSRNPAPPASTTPASREHRQQVRRPGERLGARRPGRLQHVGEVGARGGLRRRPPPRSRARR